MNHVKTTGLLPSEIARLVLGYLNQQQCEGASQSFLQECNHLAEYRSLLTGGLEYPLEINGLSLTDIIQEYCKLKFGKQQDKRSASLESVATNVSQRQLDTSVTCLQSHSTSNQPTTRLSKCMSFINSHCDQTMHDQSTQTENTTDSIPKSSAPKQFLPERDATTVQSTVTGQLSESSSLHASPAAVEVGVDDFPMVATQPNHTTPPNLTTPTQADLLNEDPEMEVEFLSQDSSAGPSMSTPSLKSCSLDRPETPIISSNPVVSLNSVLSTNCNSPMISTSTSAENPRINSNVSPVASVSTHKVAMGSVRRPGSNAHRKPNPDGQVTTNIVVDTLAVVSKTNKNTKRNIVQIGLDGEIVDNSLQPPLAGSFSQDLVDKQSSLQPAFTEHSIRLPVQHSMHSPMVGSSVTDPHLMVPVNQKGQHGQKLTDSPSKRKAAPSKKHISVPENNTLYEEMAPDFAALFDKMICDTGWQESVAENINKAMEEGSDTAVAIADVCNNALDTVEPSMYAFNKNSVRMTSSEGTSVQNSMATDRGAVEVAHIDDPVNQQNQNAPRCSSIEIHRKESYQPSLKTSGAEVPSEIAPPGRTVVLDTVATSSFIPAMPSTTAMQSSTATQSSTAMQSSIVPLNTIFANGHNAVDFASYNNSSVVMTGSSLAGQGNYSDGLLPRSMYVCTDDGVLHEVSGNQQVTYMLPVTAKLPFRQIRPRPQSQGITAQAGTAPEVAQEGTKSPAVVATAASTIPSIPVHSVGNTGTSQPGLLTPTRQTMSYHQAQHLGIPSHSNAVRVSPRLAALVGVVSPKKSSTVKKVLRYSPSRLLQTPPKKRGRPRKPITSGISLLKESRRLESNAVLSCTPLPQIASGFVNNSISAVRCDNRTNVNVEVDAAESLVALAESPSKKASGSPCKRVAASSPQKSVTLTPSKRKLSGTANKKSKRRRPLNLDTDKINKLLNHIHKT